MICTYILYVNAVECARCDNKNTLIECLKLRGLTINSSNVRIEVRY